MAFAMANPHSPPAGTVSVGGPQRRVERGGPAAGLQAGFSRDDSRPVGGSCLRLRATGRRIGGR
eukprot:12910307-Prorocentrum_lima.AAC.1